MDFHCRFSSFFSQQEMESNAKGQKVYLCTSRECTFPSRVQSVFDCISCKCCRNVATRAVRHILSCCSPFTSRGVKAGGEGRKYVHTSPANPSVRKHSFPAVIHHSPCLQNRFNYFLGMQPHIFSLCSDSS